MRSLTETLESCQSERGLTDEQFAALIGVTRSAWSMVRSGRREPGVQFLRGVMRAFPRLTDDVLVYVRDSGGRVHLPEAVTVGDVHE
jgi:transcriptional regulator with XRE-family HTH domain